MSHNESEDLYFFDEHQVDPLIIIDKSGTSNGSFRFSQCLDESETVGNEEFTDTEEEGKKKEGASGKGDEKTQSFWSDNETTKARTVDSWDFPVGPIAWDDNDKPIERLLSYADLTLTEDEENGLLTDRIVAACSSYLTRSPGTRYHVVAKVSLNNKNLNDIRILGFHRFLQYVDLSWNNLTDLTPLGCLPYLMYLDVSHNLMEEVLRFRPPLNLTYVNYSYNEVWQIDDLTDFWALSYLDLSHNKISRIQGLHNLRFLRHLDLSHNKIESFENLKYLRITDLNLEYNLISKFDMNLGLGLHHLMNIYLNNNLISTLEFIVGAHSLRQIELQNNNVSDLVELSHLKFLKNLRYLDLSGNPVSTLKPYRSLVLDCLQELKFLDQTEVKLSERAVTCKRKTFEVQLEAARNNARMVLLEQLNDTTLDLDVLPVDQGPYPFVILVGPSGSNKKSILMMLGDKYPEKIHIGRLHTTRQVLEAEDKVLIHLDKEDFHESIKAGKFLCVNENLGQLYGFSRAELAEAVKKHKLCLTAMDMVSALTIHNYGIQPFLVLAIPQSKDAHTDYLKKIYGPVMSMLGGAYIARREHEKCSKNVEEVTVILEHVLHDVMDVVYKSRTPRRRTSGISVRRISADRQEDSAFHTDSATEPVSYSTTTGCYSCTPSKCGYQSSLLDKVTRDNRLHSYVDVSKSLSTTESDTSSQKQDTSYSNSLPPEIKIEVSASDGSSCGEDNPFDDWSMPFIDWSEVNLTSAEREKAAEILCDKYIENVMSTRNTYQNLHLENPGLFSLSVFTDDTTKATKEIAKFLKDVWRSTPQRKPTFDINSDLVYKAYIPRKLEMLKQLLRKDFQSADGDGKFVCATMNQPNSPLTICNEMHLKGYGDFVENL